MYRFGGNEYFLTEKIFSLQDLLSTILLNLVLGKLGRVKQNLNLFSISHLYLMHCWI
jgi:flagellar biosynthesis protein FliR